ncbi:MAG: peptidase [Microscillaceae bacterium]|jgi:ribonuclease Z|nr:peptidase [Microscillaceae bacterium]
MLTAQLKNLANEDICLQISLPNHRWSYLCDCGFASQLTIKDCKNTEALFISHTHIDHFSNFDTLMRHQLPIGKQVVICGPQGIAQNVQHKLLAYNWQALTVDDKAVFYQIREIRAQGDIEVYEINAPEWQLISLGKLEGKYVFENEVVMVDYRILNHKTDCIAYLFEERPKVRMGDSPYPPGAWISDLKQAYLQNLDNQLITIGDQRISAQELFPYLTYSQGYRIAYVMDHLPSEENQQKIFDLCYEVDELYIEAYYKHEDQAMAWLNHHSTAKLSGALARRVQAKQLFPVHFSRRYKDEELAQVIAECMQAFVGDE